MRQLVVPILLLAGAISASNPARALSCLSPTLEMARTHAEKDTRHASVYLRGEFVPPETEAERNAVADVRAGWAQADAFPNSAPGRLLRTLGNSTHRLDLEFRGRILGATREGTTLMFEDAPDSVFRLEISRTCDSAWCGEFPFGVLDPTRTSPAMTVVAHLDASIAAPLPFEGELLTETLEADPSRTRPHLDVVLDPCNGNLIRSR